MADNESDTYTIPIRLRGKEREDFLKFAESNKDKSKADLLREFLLKNASNATNVNTTPTQQEQNTTQQPPTQLKSNDKVNDKDEVKKNSISTALPITYSPIINAEAKLAEKVTDTSAKILDAATAEMQKKIDIADKAMKEKEAELEKLRTLVKQSQDNNKPHEYELLKSVLDEERKKYEQEKERLMQMLLDEKERLVKSVKENEVDKVRKELENKIQELQKSLSGKKFEIDGKDIIDALSTILPSALGRVDRYIIAKQETERMKTGLELMERTTLFLAKLKKLGIEINSKDVHETLKTIRTLTKSSTDISLGASEDTFTDEDKIQ